MSVGNYVMFFGVSCVAVVAGHSLLTAILGPGFTPRKDFHLVQNTPCMSESDHLAQCISIARKNLSACQVYMNY